MQFERIKIEDDPNWIECFATSKADNGDMIKLSVWLSCSGFMASKTNLSTSERGVYRLDAECLKDAKKEAIAWFVGKPIKLKRKKLN